MYCLHCGDCCLRMSPLSAPYACEHIKQVDDFYFCGIYGKRPEQCENHTFHSQFCPIGIGKLKLDDIDAIRKRIDDGYEITEEMKWM